MPSTGEPGVAAATPHIARGHIARRWTEAFVVGELVGFIPPAVTGAALAAADASDVWLVVGLATAGMIEGAVIGIAQARVLAWAAPAVDGRAWVRATIAAAGFAWFAGMGGGALMGSDAASAVVLVALVPAWVAALLAMGLLQWRVLRRVVPASGRWVPVTAGAWLLGVLMPIATLSAVPNGWPPAAHAVAGLVGAVAMGLTVGLLTGHTLEGLVVGASAAPPSARAEVRSPTTRVAAGDDRR